MKRLLVPLMTLSYFSTVTSGTYLPGYMTVNSTNQVIEYTFFTSKVTWNDARQTCLSIGAELAALTSQYVIEYLTQGLAEDYGVHIPGTYWMGLYERLPGQPKWTLDCISHGLDNVLLTWEDDKHCFFRSPVLNTQALRDKCNNKHYFVCQKFTTKECKMDSSFYAHRWDTHQYVTYTSCADSCFTCDECTDALFQSSGGDIGTCYIFSTIKQNAWSQPLHLISKYCIKAILNTTYVESKYTGLLPVSGCTGDEAIVLEEAQGSSSPTISPSPVTSSGVLPNISYVGSTLVTSFGVDTYTVSPMVDVETSTVSPVVDVDTSTVSPMVDVETSTASPMVDVETSTASPMVDVYTSTVSPMVDIYTSTVSPIVNIETSTVASKDAGSWTPEISTITENPTGELSSFGLESCPCTDTETVFYTTTSPCDVITQTCIVETSTPIVSDVTRSGWYDFNEIVRNLTIHVTDTSAYARKLKSAEDARRSSAVMGWVGVISVVVPILFIVLSDIKLKTCFRNSDLTKVKTWK